MDARLLPLFLIRVWPGLFSQVRELWRSATSASSRRLRYEIAPSGITVRESANGVEQPPIHLPRERIGALSFAPRGSAWAEERDGGELRVIRTEVGSALRALLRATL